MYDFKVVPSGLDISRRIANYLEDAAPTDYRFEERAHAIRAINDILQGRASRTVDELLVELEQYGGETFIPVQSDIRDFLRQKELLTHPYEKCSRGKRYVFKRHQNAEGHSLKAIDQELYDRAAKGGFPSDFFSEAYFDGVTFYCLPNAADFFGSELHNCKFAVCRAKSISFCYTHFFDTEFYSCVLNDVDFYKAVLANTHFRDCELSRVRFQVAIMRHCNIIDCTLDDVDYAGATLDSCSFGRVTARNIQLDYATIIQGGATEEECRRNRQAIYQALGVKQVAA